MVAASIVVVVADDCGGGDRPTIPSLGMSRGGGEDDDDKPLEVGTGSPSLLLRSRQRFFFSADVIASMEEEWRQLRTP